MDRGRAPNGIAHLIDNNVWCVCVFVWVCVCVCVGGGGGVHR